jgi:hypothetical protein
MDQSPHPHQPKTDIYRGEVEQTDGVLAAVRGPAFVWRLSDLAKAFENRWIQVVLLLGVLLLLLPPNGILTDNEENYFQLAAKAVSGLPTAATSGVFDASRHRFVNEFLLGNLIAFTGFESAQMITRLLAAIAFAALLPFVFRLFALSILDGVIVIIAFAGLDQSLMGGEWIFHGFEAKVVAYGLVLAALCATRLRHNLVGVTALCALATYFHFLVGIFWFGAILVLLLVEGKNKFRDVVIAGMAFLIATAPLTGLIVSTRLNDLPATDIADTPSPDVIFSLIREPWHGAPFISRYNFVVQWLPGYLFAAAMLAACVVIARTSHQQRQRRFAVWLALLICYLFLALVPAFIERHTGAVGKYYPFRPSSLILLLWLMLAASWLNELITRHSSVIKPLALALMLPSFLSAAMLRVYHDLDTRATFAADKAAIADYLATMPPEAVVLVDPAIEPLFLDLERRTSHPFLVSQKFAPTNDRELREWYRRSEFRNAVFRDGCASSLAYPVDFLLTTPANAAALTPGCGTVAIETAHWRLLRRHARE